MTKYMVLFAALVMTACTANGQKDQKETPKIVEVKKAYVPDSVRLVNRTDAEWKALLTPQQYHVLRNKGTDAPFTGEYTYTEEDGKYFCAGCGLELFTSDMKFNSSCGWPSFDEEIAGGKIKKQVDNTHGMKRVEILCGRCGSHLGHLFDDGPTLTGQRYCVNSTSVNFTPAKEKKAQK